MRFHRPDGGQLFGSGPDPFSKLGAECCPYLHTATYFLTSDIKDPASGFPLSTSNAYKGETEPAVEAKQAFLSACHVQGIHRSDHVSKRAGVESTGEEAST